MLLGIFILIYGLDDAALLDNVVRRGVQSTLQNHTNDHKNKTTTDNQTKTDLLDLGVDPIAKPVVAGPDSAADDGGDKSLFMLSILISVCVLAVLSVFMSIVCWVRISQNKKPREDDMRSRGAENLDQQNMRDVQLTEYEKRKRQMKELDDQNEEPPDINPDESDDGGELDEITAVQSQPLEEETIVNPNFIHHYMSRTSGRGGNGFSS